MDNIEQSEKVLWDYYFSLIHEFGKNKRKIENSPRGYISKKRVNGKEYFYYQVRADDTVKSYYLKAEEIDGLAERIEQRKIAKEKNKELLKRIKKVEKALPKIQPVYYKGQMISFSIRGGYVYMKCGDEATMFGLATERVLKILGVGAELFARGVLKRNQLSEGKIVSGEDDD